MLGGVYKVRPANAAPVPDGGKLISSRFIQRIVPVSKVTLANYGIKSSSPLRAFRISVIENKDGSRYSFAEYMAENERAGEREISATFRPLGEGLALREFAAIISKRGALRTHAMETPLRTLISQSSLSERDFARLESEALRLRERYLSNPQCPQWYRDRADDMTFWRQFHGSQPLVGWRGAS